MDRLCFFVKNKNKDRLRTGDNFVRYDKGTGTDLSEIQTVISFMTHI